jgi:hypothetical protein
MIPHEISEINVQYIHKINNSEYASSCPQCGGTMHRNGEKPDRFRIWFNSKTTGGVMGWCRQCGYTWFPKGQNVDPAKHQEWINERRNQELQKKEKVEHAIGLLQQEQVWLKYHENLNEDRRYFYYDRKIEDYWIEYWLLGYNLEKVIWNGHAEYKTPTLTIPVFEPETRRVITIRHRLLQPQDQSDKYRPEFGGLPASLYFTDLDKKPKNKVIIVEGEFKAMTTYITLDDPNMFVVGLPGKSPNLEMLQVLDECEVVYLLLDPDAFVKQKNDQITPIRRLVDHFKEKSRVISLPYKVDDMISNGMIEKQDLKQLINTARKYK